jgi:hypothetical protein
MKAHLTRSPLPNSYECRTNQLMLAKYSCLIMLSNITSIHRPKFQIVDWKGRGRYLHCVLSSHNMTMQYRENSVSQLYNNHTVAHVYDMTVKMNIRKELTVTNYATHETNV